MRKKRKIGLQKKFIWGLLVFALVLAASLSILLARRYRSSMEEHYSAIAFSQAQVAADYIDGDQIRRYYQTGEKDSYYEQVRAFLTNVKEDVGLKYYYVVVPEEDDYVYIWDSGELDEQGVCDLLDHDRYYNDANRLMHSAFSKDAQRVIFTTDTEMYGYITSAYLPLFDSDGNPVALIGVDIDLDKINQDIHHVVGIMLNVVIVDLLIAIGLFYVFIHKSIITPLKKLDHVTQNLIHQDDVQLNTFQVDIHTRDEIEDLANAFSNMTVQLHSYIENLAAVTAEKERIGAELNVATKIQADMLPRIFPPYPDRSEFDLFATMDPAKEVGGDFYDFFMIDDMHLGVVIGDVSGKGVPAALFMVISKTLIKNYAMMGLPVDEILAHANNDLCVGNDAQLFTTAWIGIYEINTRKLSFADAGHETAIKLKADGTLEELKPAKKKLALAIMEDIPYLVNEVTFEPTDLLFIYTDGVPEATNAQVELYGMERMEAVLAKHRGGNPQQLLQEIRKDVDTFVGDAPQFDDLTMLALEIRS